MKAAFENMKDITLLDKTVSIKTRVTEDTLRELEALADEIMKHI